MEVPPGGSRQITPPAGFTVTDLVVISNVLRGKDQGGFTINDPPGEAQLSEIPVLCAEDDTPLYSFAFVGANMDFGPVTATVPIAQDGFEDTGIPRLFAAAVDPATGLMVLNDGPGHCPIPTATRINDSVTGEILPDFSFGGISQVCGKIELLDRAPLATPTEKN